MGPSGVQSSGKERARNRRGEGVRLRSEIVAAAGRLLDQTGRREAVTLRAVAREVGITPMSIYSHFPDREAILAEVLKETLRELTAALTSRDDARPDPVDRLLVRCAAYVTFAQERPQRHRLLDSFVHGTEAPEEARATFGLFVSGVGDCVAAGRSQSVDPFTDATAVWVAVHGYATLRSRHPDFPWPATEAAWIEDIILRLARVSSVDREVS
jgi:AcrR family transcriptional regulator